ncbi:Retrovirus-related Pol polyprotein from transposon TNT 1-94 [Abeliophyllum distichum]|uniref:Retrovirus-related Pol polyprotein from transposon TNT 1-94 n=1 Tax=Abeliophyllum distichum TaxID=126358 RepID=A0ABD1PQP5_9LAMI
MHNGIVKTIHNVRYVNNLKRNIIALGVLEDEGYWYKSEGSVLKIVKGAMAVMKGLKKNGLYYLQGEALMANGKSHRLSFGKGPHNSLKPLAYIHDDLWWPKKHPTNGGYPIRVKGYRLWMSEEMGIKIINSRDVIFNEIEMPKLTNIGESETYQIDKVVTDISRGKVRQKIAEKHQPGDHLNETSGVDATNPIEPPSNPMIEVQPVVIEQTDIQNYQLVRDIKRR